jgi:hybrid cluster-associated redox disulfide protein
MEDAAGCGAASSILFFAPAQRHFPCLGISLRLNLQMENYSMAQAYNGNHLISPLSIVSDVLDRWPQTIPVFVKYRTSCIGCSMSCFETLQDAARNYSLPLNQFLRDLEEAILAG